MINVIERKVEGKHNMETCEDAIVLTPHFVAVIDGSTSKTTFRHYHGASNGRMAMTIIKNYIEREAEANMTIDSFCRGVTSYINQIYRVSQNLRRMEQHPEERLTASVAIYSCERKEVWMIGDCQAIVDQVYYNNDKPDEAVIAAKRSQLIKQGVTPSEARRLIEPMLVRSVIGGQNKSYAVVDGFPVFMQGVIVIPAHSEVVLATDGYPFLRSTLAESEETLSRQLRKDPQNIETFLATKGIKEGNSSFDDRAFIRFSVL